MAENGTMAPMQAIYSEAAVKRSLVAICQARYPWFSKDFDRFVSLIWADVGYVLVRFPHGLGLVWEGGLGEMGQ